MQHNLWLEIAISVGATASAIAHVIWPGLKIDAVTLGLLVLAVLPWLSSLIESAKFPGGWEIKFRNLESAVQKVIGEEPGQSTAAPQTTDHATLQFLVSDPNVALVALRVEIEKRIRAIAEVPAFRTNDHQ